MSGTGVSAFGVTHEIRKYSRAYGTAREVEDKTTRLKLRPLPDTKAILIKKKPKKARVSKELGVSTAAAKAVKRVAGPAKLNQMKRTYRLHQLSWAERAKVKT